MIKTRMLKLNTRSCNKWIYIGLRVYGCANPPPPLPQQQQQNQLVLSYEVTKEGGVEGALGGGGSNF